MQTLSNQNTQRNTFDSIGQQLRLLTIATVGLGSFSTGTLEAKDSLWSERSLPATEQVVSKQSKLYEIRNRYSISDDWSTDNRLFSIGSYLLSAQQEKAINTILKDHPDWTVILAKGTEAMPLINGDGTPTQDYKDLQKTLQHFVAPNVFCREYTKAMSGAMLFITFDKDMNHGKVAFFGDVNRVDLDLGGENWSGNLDKFALPSLKAKNKDIVAAVSATVKNIDSLYKERMESPFYLSKPYRPVALFAGGMTFVFGGLLGLLAYAGSRSSERRSGFSSSSSGSSTSFSAGVVSASVGIAVGSSFGDSSGGSSNFGSSDF